MSGLYDQQNIFAKILRGDIPCNKVDECDHTLSFYDIQPQRKVHILVIPKGAYTGYDRFLHKCICRRTDSLFCRYRACCLHCRS